jgi:hypothetical protein
MLRDGGWRKAAGWKLDKGLEAGGHLRDRRAGDLRVGTSVGVQLEEGRQRRDGECCKEQRLVSVILQIDLA